MYEGKLYEFTSAHETAGEWDPTEVTETTVGDELSSLESGLTNKINIGASHSSVFSFDDDSITFVGATNVTNMPESGKRGMVFTGILSSSPLVAMLFVVLENGHAYTNIYEDSTWGGWQPTGNYNS